MNTLRELKRHRLISCLVFGISICVCCLSMLCWIGLVTLEERRYPETLLEAEIPFDRRYLPEQPTEADYYGLAVDVLNRYGWEVVPRLTALGWNAPCSELGTPFEEMWFYFSKKELSIGEHADSLLPHRIRASVFVNASEGKISFEFRDQGMSLQPQDRKLDLQSVAVDLEKALEIAEEGGGQAYRQRVRDQCDVDVFFKKHIWEIAYREPRERRHVFAVTIDARTGKYETYPK